MHQECGVKPRVPLTFGRRCVCVTAAPPDVLLSPSKAISIHPHTALTAPADPSALLRCYVSSCGRSWALQKAQKYGKLSWGQWSQVISGEMCPVWGQLHPFSPWDRDTACQGEGEPVKYGPGEEEENIWGTATLGQRVTTKRGSHHTLPGVLGMSLVCQCSALSGYSWALHLAVQWWWGIVCCSEAGHCNSLMSTHFTFFLPVGSPGVRI